MFRPLSGIIYLFLCRFSYLFRFEAKRHGNDPHRPHSTAARFSKSTSAGTARARFEKATQQSSAGKAERPHSTARKDGQSHHGAGDHGAGHHGTDHHGTGHHGTGHHGTSHHGTSHHGTSHHGPSHDGSSHQKHGTSHPRTFRKELRSHHKPAGDEKPAEDSTDSDVPLSAASIRSKFEAASKGNAPVKRKVGWLFIYEALKKFGQNSGERMVTIMVHEMLPMKWSLQCRIGVNSPLGWTASNFHALNSNLRPLS